MVVVVAQSYCPQKQANVPVFEAGVVDGGGRGGAESNCPRKRADLLVFKGGDGGGDAREQWWWSQWCREQPLHTHF